MWVWWDGKRWYSTYRYYFSHSPQGVRDFAKYRVDPKLSDLDLIPDYFC